MLVYFINNFNVLCFFKFRNLVKLSIIERKLLFKNICLFTTIKILIVVVNINFIKYINKINFFFFY